MMAATPKPRLVKLVMSPTGTARFSTGATGFTRVDPPGKAPAFVGSEQPLYAGGPLWRIELTSPVWPQATHDTK